MVDNSCGWIWLRGLRVENARVGIYAFEQQKTQPVIVDLGMWVNTARAAASEDVAHTVDWAAVAQAVADTVRARHYRLIETLTETLASSIMEDFGVDWVRVEVRKPESLAIGMASVSIERRRLPPGS